VELGRPGRKGEEVNEWSSGPFSGIFWAVEGGFYSKCYDRVNTFLVISWPFLQDPSVYADAEIVLLVTGANLSPEVLRRAVT
jgi:hypothetical protein